MKKSRLIANVSNDTWKTIKVLAAEKGIRVSQVLEFLVFVYEETEKTKGEK